MTAFDPNATDFGTDVFLQDDLPPVWGLAQDEINYALSCVRRVSQREGSMDFYDPTYVCLDLRTKLNAKMGKADISLLQGQIAAAQESDPRTSSSTATATFDPVANALTVAINNETADGPFDLVLQATSVTIAILAINGVATPTLAAAAAPAPTTTITIVAGGNQPGPPGPPGTSNPSRNWGLAPVESSLGTEDPQAQTQFEVDWSIFDSSVTLEMSGIGSDSGAPGAGNGVFKLRINGSDGAADGTVELTLTATTASATRLQASATISNPGGTGRFIVTATSSGSGNTAELRGISFSIQGN